MHFHAHIHSCLFRGLQLLKLLVNVPLVVVESHGVSISKCANQE